MNNKIKLISDSTCDLPKELIERLNIEILPLTVVFKDEEFHDLVNITPTQMYKKVEEKGYLPKTSAITIHPFYNIFDKYTKLGYDIIYTGIGSKLSASFQNALNAKEEGKFTNVYLVDSGNLSSSIGLILLKMDQMKKEGYSAEKIKQVVEEKIVPNIRCSFVIKSMDYLHKGGRCSGIKKFLGTWLKIKPIITVRNGKLEVHSTPRGKLEKALKLIYNEALEIKEKIDLDFFFITHTCSSQNVNYIYPLVKENINPKELIIAEAGCVIASHCGPETIGLLYILK